VATVNSRLAAGGPTDLTIFFVPSNIPALEGIDGESPAAAVHHFEITGSQFNERLLVFNGTVANGTVARKVRLVGLPHPSAGYRPVLRLKKSPYGGWLNGTGHDWLLQTYPGRGSVGEAYLEYMEVKDLVLDGDFDAQGTYASAANLSGYKSFAMDLGARTGLIENVLVRRFGSVGEVPGNYFNAAGTEAFPITVWTRANDKVTAGPQSDWNAPRNYPWLIQKTEVSDFRTIHGGYATLLMPVVQEKVADVPANGSNPPPAPVIAVRQCQVRPGNSGVIATGTAASGTYQYPDPNDSSKTLTGYYQSDRILWEDNVILNTGVGLNTDTGGINWLTIRRNVFLDVYQGFNLGQPDVGRTAPANHHHYTIEQNLIRLRGQLNWANYRNWNATSTGVIATDPNLALGRLYAQPSQGMIINGRASYITFQDNRLTTWPVNGADNRFFWPSLGTAPATPQYRVVWSLPPNTFIDTVVDVRNRFPSSFVTFQNCHRSTKAMEFGDGPIADPLVPAGNPPTENFLAAFPQAPLDPPPPSPFNAYPYTGSYSHGYQDLKTPPEAAKNGQNQYIFVPARNARTERVQSVYNETTGQLESIYEIILGECSISGNTVSGSIRLMKHSLPGTAAPGTTAFANWGLRIKAEVSVDGTPFLPQIDGASDFTDSNGVLTFNNLDLKGPGATTPLPNHAVVRLKAWFDHAQPDGPSSDLPREDVDAWSSLEISNGTTVEVVATPDVADDKNTTAGKRAKFRVRRNANANGNWTGLPAQNVRVQLVDTGLLRPTDNANLTASYGATADYYLTGGGISWPTASGLPAAQTVTIPANEEFTELTVVPIADNKTEANVIRLQVLPDSTAANANSPTYSVGTSRQADVAIYDGPEFTLYELADNRWTPLNLNWSIANTVATGINSAASPQVSGWADHIAPPYSTPGGYWQTSWGAINDIWNVRGGGYSPQPYGIANSGMMVGIIPYVSPTRGFWRSGVTEQQLGPTAGGNSGAYGLNPGATAAAHYIAGFSPVNRVRKPVVWINNIIRNLSQTLANPATFTGEARGVNDAGHVVGTAQFTSGGFSRPFRSKAAGDYLQASSDELPVPAGAADQSGIANAVSAEGVAVGSFKFDAISLKMAAYWPARPVASANPQGTTLASWYPPGKPPNPYNNTADALSEALGIARISGVDWIVGWSGSSETSPSSWNPNIKATLKKSSNSTWLDLNDKYLVHGTTGWALKRATAVNTQGYIVGNGLLNSSPRGFLLVPRTIGQ
jgi:hypothetical protein